MRKNVLITGASGSIGSATALEFAKAGCNLFLVCNSRINELDEFADKLSSGYDIEVFTASIDFSDTARSKDALDDFLGETTIDILINNAGVSYVGLFQDMSASSWNNIVNINLNSVYATSSVVIPGMVRKQSGKIINVSSVWGNVGASCEVAYSATKGGVNAFTKALAKELALSGISVNAISPGLVDTPMNSHLSDDELNELFDQIPMGRAATPGEIAKCIIKLSDMPAYVTGQIITADGGWT
ncbi:MAG: SDR family NAD(P)-dependent oxidoreductase [Lachnospiraceae bacterium]|nr:SDR family NAD(P)-dependent oxidoreductase [Lachnospiraceae bacterium]